MSKILAVSDVHISDYADRNPSNRFRLYQTRTVAQNIIDVGKQEGCDYIVFCGDIVDRATSRAYVLSEVKLFLDTIMANFTKGYIILGNHDLDSKSQTQLLSDSVLGVMLPNNLYYTHQQVINIDGVSCAFCNWMPDFDLTFIPNKVDILFSHATICYNDSELFKSQVLDSSKFSLGIFGDIHRMGQKIVGDSTYVSIGVPQKCKMSDSDDSSGVVVDTSNKSWKWVNLNPFNNLLIFKTTTNLEEEGYHDDEFTWYVYKDPISLVSNRNSGLIIDTWTEISSLIEQAINQTGLQAVHQEVLKNIRDIDENTVDFNFHLKKLHCSNWRSITDATIDFGDGTNNKIFLSGANGSGKSSLLEALRYAFIDCSTIGAGIMSLKSFVQFGKKDCLTEVWFDYKGSEYKLSRGTKEYSLTINGELQKYNNKKQFEQDVRDRFKFISFIDDVLIFSAEHGRFVSGVSSERLTEIISRFLKLDRLDTLNSTATLMYDEIKKDKIQWTAKVSETEKILNYIQEKLNLINLPSISLQQLEQLKQEGLELQRKNNLWNQYVSKTANLQAKIDTYTNNLNELIEKSRTFRDINFIDQEIAQYNQEIENLNNRLVELGNIRVNLDYKNRECNKLRQDGNRYWTEAKNIGIGRHCSYCGQEIKNTESMENHKNELLRKVEELKPQVQQLQKEIDELTYLKDNSEQEYNKINQDIKLYNSEISKRMSEKTEISQTYNRINQIEDILRTTKNDLLNLGIVEKVELPPDFMNKMGELELGINAWKQWESAENDKNIKLDELNKLKQEVSKIDSCLDALENYCKLTGPIGVIYESIMNKLAKSYSDNIVEYEVVRSGKNNRERLSLIPMFKKGKEKIPYGLASSGEKTILDIHMLEKLIPNSGLLILDEFLKNLDEKKLSIVEEILTSLNVGTLILTSHALVGNFYNRLISLSLDDKEHTQIKCS